MDIEAPPFCTNPNTLTAENQPTEPAQKTVMDTTRTPTESSPMVPTPPKDPTSTIGTDTCTPHPESPTHYTSQHTGRRWYAKPSPPPAINTRNLQGKHIPLKAFNNKPNYGLPGYPIPSKHQHYAPDMQTPNYNNQPNFLDHQCTELPPDEQMLGRRETPIAPGTYRNQHAHNWLSAGKQKG